MGATAMIAKLRIDALLPSHGREPNFGNEAMRSVAPLEIAFTVEVAQGQGRAEGIVQLRVAREAGVVLAPHVVFKGVRIIFERGQSAWA